MGPRQGSGATCRAAELAASRGAGNPQSVRPFPADPQESGQGHGRELQFLPSLLSP